MGSGGWDDDLHNIEEIYFREGEFLEERLAIR